MNAAPDGTPAAWLRHRLAKAAEPPRDSADIQGQHHLRDDLAIDSLAFIELMVEFEEAFELRMDEGDLLLGRYETVQDLISRASNRLAVD
jgi:acyl carrier protein